MIRNKIGKLRFMEDLWIENYRLISQEIAQKRDSNSSPKLIVETIEIGLNYKQETTRRIDLNWIKGLVDYKGKMIYFRAMFTKEKNKGTYSKAAILIRKNIIMFFENIFS